MSYFPFFLEIRGKDCLVVGGGAVAARKIQVLKEFGVKITIVSPEICDELAGVMKKDKALILNKRKFEDSDIMDQLFVIAATDNRDVNHQVSSLCQEKGILVNVCDCKEECTFIFPSIVKREDIVVGISSSGESPDVSKWLRKHIGEEVPEFLPELSDNLGKYRPIVKEHVDDVDTRKKVFRELFQAGMRGKGKINDNMVEKIISKYE